MSRFAPWEEVLIRELSQGLPVVQEPFTALAKVAGVSVDQVLERIEAWKEDGTIRRFGARVNHRSLGYTANGMSVWEVPEDQIDIVAKHMITLPEITHCYQRPAYAGWQYTLYAMIHAATEDEVRAIAARIAEKEKIEHYDVLFSSTEFKKSTPRYFVE